MSDPKSLRRPKTRTRLVQFMMTAEEFEHLQALMAARDLTASEIIRKAVARESV